MFIIKQLEEKINTELQILYKKIKRSLGFVPPHFKLFAILDIDSLRKFIENNFYFTKHKKIDAKLLIYLRLYIAKVGNQEYCINFNTKMLLGQGVSKIVVNNIVDEIDNLPVTKEQLMLLKKVLYAIYNAKLFGVDDLKELYEVGFNDKDFYDLLSYGVDFMAKSKMIEIYLSPKEE